MQSGELGSVPIGRDASWGWEAGSTQAYTICEISQVLGVLEYDGPRKPAYC